MSMLTPPGMGGKYRVKGDRYVQMRRPRRRRRLVIAAVAAATALGVLGWGSLQLLDVFTGNTAANASDRKKAPAACEKTSGTRQDGAKPGGGAKEKHPEPKQLTVNVLNATKRSGLAKSTADELKKRGFTIGEVGNAPAGLDKKVKEPGLLVGKPGKRTGAAMKVLGTQLEGTATRYDDRKGEEIDLVLGKGFDKLRGAGEAARALTALDRPEPAPAPSGCEKQDSHGS